MWKEVSQAILIETVFSLTHELQPILFHNSECVSYAVRHYEVVYLIHEDHKEEVESVNMMVRGVYCFFNSIRNDTCWH